MICLSLSIILIPSHILLKKKKNIPPHKMSWKGFPPFLLKSLWNISVVSSLNIWKRLLMKLMGLKFSLWEVL